MLDQLSDRLQKALKFLRGEGKVTEKNMTEALRMVRMAFLEADVNFTVVKDFEKRIREKALNEKVLESLTPAQQVIKIIRDELTVILGKDDRKLNIGATPPSKYMLVGLQGAGKTTTCGKLGKLLSQSGKNPLFVSFDLKRPAAQDQLQMIAHNLNLPFYRLSREDMKKPLKALAEVIKLARTQSHNPLIVDTAGRLHVDQDLMDELLLIKKTLVPDEVIYVGDAMTGQDAVKSAQAFDEQIGLTSVILTKLDGDARGGAALSIVSVTGKPIKYVGVGEKYDQLEMFHPDRMASRILGMGDMLTLIEKAESEADAEESAEIARKMMRQEFTLDDFRKQILQFKKMGSMSQMLSMFPQSGPFKNINKVDIDDN
ncbi:MAG: signal recognition particle protein Srp54, partial [Candidatus Aminicenantes bacterium]|nr:signal recognition particle protein Srp54 [Candidatus Aminicenantes bacterium]